jgi:hypothetical protein
MFVVVLKHWGFHEMGLNMQTSWKKRGKKLAQVEPIALAKASL